VKLDAEQAARTLPRLLEAYDWAKANGWDGRVAKSQRDGMTSALKRIALHADSANVVIEMLLANAALDNRQTTLTPCSMSAIVQAAIDRYIFKGNQRVLVTTDLREDFMFRGSEALMTHTFFNLMKNSLRAVEKTGHGEITITVRREGTNGIVDFADTGHGMTSEQAARIFTPFFTSESLGIGNGIGLSFCRGVVERFGGTISCQSALGKGTTFRISLPVLESRHLATAETYKTDAAERSSDGTPTVVAD
jgi:signal transduction histidine kinase